MRLTSIRRVLNSLLAIYITRLLCNYSDDNDGGGVDNPLSLSHLLRLMQYVEISEFRSMRAVSSSLCMSREEGEVTDKTLLFINSLA